MHEIYSRPQDVDVNFEMEVDDKDHLGVDEGMADGDDNDGLEPEPSIAMPAGGKRDLIVGLWPFAFSKEYYKAIIAGFCGGERLSHIVVLSTSAHPACALAAHDLRLTAHIHLDRVSAHSKAHGRAILQDFLHQEFLNAEQGQQALVAGGVKRRRELCFIKVSAPAVGTQAPCFSEVSCCPSSGWRGGLNEYPALDTLEVGILELLQRELENFGLAMRPGQAGGRPVLFTEKARGEGDILCPVSCLLFSCAAGLRDCLRSAGALLDGPLIHVTGLRCPGPGDEGGPGDKGGPGEEGGPGDVGGPGGKVMDAYAIPVGAARLVSDYQAAGRHHPNACMRARPSVGPNDGFLELIVRTHNGHGIAAGREIVLDFGAARAHSLDPNASPTKRFKGALDDLLAKQMAKASALAAEGEATPSVAPAAAPVATPVRALAAEGVSKCPRCERTWAPPDPHCGLCTLCNVQVEKIVAPTAAPALAPAATPGAARLATEDSFRLELQADNTVTIYSAKEKMTRIAAKTILKVFDKGTMDDAPHDASEMVKWSFRRCNAQVRQAAWRVGQGSGGRARPGYTRGRKRAREKGQGSGGISLTSRQVVVSTDHTDGYRITSLAELISSSRAEKLWNHQKWTPAGVPPPILTVKTPKAFMAQGELTDVFPRLVRHLQAGSKLSLLWVVKVKGAIIYPHGLALVVGKQIVAKAEGTNL